jgi:hypothetical protein
MTLTPRFEQALNYTCIVHAGHLRKGTPIPYVAHLLGVASLALEHGADGGDGSGGLAGLQEC